MARPTYQTKKNLDGEKKAIELIADSWNVNFIKLPISYHLDYGMVRDGVTVGFAEIKVRTNPVGSYSTYMIALSKAMKANELTTVTGKPCLLIVQWTDCLGWIDFSNDFELSFGGRTDRNDWEDQEPVALYPTSAFKIKQ